MTAALKSRRIQGAIGTIAPPIDTANLEANVGYALRRAQARVFADFHRMSAHLNLKPAAFSILLLVRDNRGRKPSEFADALGIQRPNFASLVDELCKRRLLVRTASPQDRRSHALSLSAQGEALLAESVPLVEAHNARMMARLTASEMRTLMSLIDKVAR